MGGIVQLHRQNRGERVRITQHEINVLGGHAIHVSLPVVRVVRQPDQIRQPHFHKEVQIIADDASQHLVERALGRREEMIHLAIGQRGPGAACEIAQDAQDGESAQRCQGD